MEHFVLFESEEAFMKDAMIFNGRYNEFSKRERRNRRFQRKETAWRHGIACELSHFQVCPRGYRILKLDGI